MRQQAAALRSVESDALERFAVDPGNPVVPGERSVDERERRVEQVEHAAVLAHDLLQEQLGLGAHRVAELVVDGREPRRVRLGAVERA